MTSILYIGMDVHTTNYTLCSYSLETQQPFGRMQVEPDYKLHSAEPAAAVAV